MPLYLEGFFTSSFLRRCFHYLCAMAKILCLETATTNCSVAIGVDGEVVSLVEDSSSGYSHAEQLHVFIQQAMTKASLAFDNLDAIAVSKGPGSYTGLRIGVSAAKGLCFSLGTPLISIATLQSMAYQIQVGSDEVIISLLDARRMEVYSCAFDHQYREIGTTKAEIINVNSFEDYKSYHQVHLIGSGSEKCQTVLADKHFTFHPEIVPSANEMVYLAEQKFNQKEMEDVAYFEPYYLKDFILQGKKKA